MATMLPLVEVYDFNLVDVLLITIPASIIGIPPMALVMSHHGVDPDTTKAGAACRPGFRVLNGMLTPMRKPYTAHARPLVPVLVAVLLAATGSPRPSGRGSRELPLPIRARTFPASTLPGPVAAGRLGGAIYDVVYRLVVHPGT